MVLPLENIGLGQVEVELEFWDVDELILDDGVEVYDVVAVDEEDKIEEEHFDQLVILLEVLHVVFLVQVFRVQLVFYVDVVLIDDLDLAQHFYPGVVELAQKQHILG